jgi:phenylalanyl-tRNA synthetase beta chain
MYLRDDTTLMKVSFHWLKDYLNFDKTPEQLSEILTSTGLEVEGIESIGAVTGGLEGVVTGKVTSCEKHPDADKLKVTMVDVGDETLQIVCGASNVAAGQMVLVARAGATIYPLHGEPITLRKATIRGIESNGMICAEDELGIGSSHDGIMVLSNDISVGIPAAEALKLDVDHIFEIGLTPNRCDAMGHFGVARDLRAYLNFHEGLNSPMIRPETVSLTEHIEDTISYMVAKDSGCSAYYVASIKGVKIHRETTALGQRLQSIGVSNINNVVDCANYVMHEFGTPLHAFDAQYFNHELQVRFAQPGEELTTLDGITRKLRSEDVVIAGDGRVQCLAGVMGGKESGVDETTVDLLIESAIFEPSFIRKSAKHHGIHSDASFRFERGVDPAFTLLALRRAVSLILEHAGGTFEGIREVVREIPKAVRVDFELDYVNRILGSHLEKEGIKNILESLDIVPVDQGQWEIPRYRHDVKRPIDIVEEVARIAGFKNIPSLKKWSFSVPVSEGISSNRLRHQLAITLASKGFSEILNNSLTKSKYSELSLPKEAGAAIPLQNPLSKDLSILRNSIFFGMLETVAYNRNRQANNLKLFEFGQTYHGFGKQHSEKSMLGIVISGTYQPESWIGSRPFTFFDLKGHVLDLIQCFGSQAITEKAFEQEGAFQEGVHISLQGKKLGSAGVISSTWAKAFGLKQTVYAAQIDLKVLHEAVKQLKVEFRELPKTFLVRRDFALVVDEAVEYNEIIATAKKAASRRLIKCSLFDVYQGDKIESGKKSYAIAFYFQDPNKTLTDVEIDGEMEAIKNELSARLSATLR